MTPTLCSNCIVGVGGPVLRCSLDYGHIGLHRDENGAEWRTLTRLEAAAAAQSASVSVSGGVPTETPTAPGLRSELEVIVDRELENVERTYLAEDIVTAVLAHPEVERALLLLSVVRDALGVS